MNSTGNNSGNDRNRSLGALPDLIYPAIRWDDDDYARLQARLDFFQDFIMLSKFERGEVTRQHIVDPAEVATALAGIDLNSGLLPPDVLFWSRRHGQVRLGLYLPPQIRLVTIRDEAQAWRVPLPGLIFVGHGYNYTAWAVTERPTSPETRLYMAPCPNVHPEGVCRGNAPFPQADPATIWHAVDIFFSSKFNRDLSNQKSQAYPNCVLDQWRALHQAEADVYPLDDLVKTHLTIGRLIHGQTP